MIGENFFFYATADHCEIVRPAPTDIFIQASILISIPIQPLSNPISSS